MRPLAILLVLAVLTGCASLATPIGYESPDTRRARIWKRVAVDVGTLGLGEVFFIGRGKQLEAEAEWQAYATQLRADPLLVRLRGEHRVLPAYPAHPARTRALAHET